MRRKMDAEGFMPLSLIASFNRMKQLTRDVSLIIEACKDSKELEVKEDIWVRNFLKMLNFNICWVIFGKLMIMIMYLLKDFNFIYINFSKLFLSCPKKIYNFLVETHHTHQGEKVCKFKTLVGVQQSGNTWRGSCQCRGEQKVSSYMSML